VFIFFADMAAPSLATPALGCMQEIQRQCFLLGIPLKTRHREVAPNQFEFAPLYGFVTTQIDQNLMVMQIIEETAASFGLAALFQEKPFQVRCNRCCAYVYCMSCGHGTTATGVSKLAKSYSEIRFPDFASLIPWVTIVYYFFHGAGRERVRQAQQLVHVDRRRHQSAQRQGAAERHR
jgi:hypothetical protein